MSNTTIEAPGNRAPLASVIVPTTGRRPESLARLLNALAGQDVAPGAFEVIVVTDGSGDAVAAAGVARMPFGLRSISHRINRGRAAACNTGIRAAGAALIALLDDDMEPAAGWLSGHLQAHADNVRVGVIGSAPIARETLRNPVGEYFRRRFDRHLAKLSHASRIGYRDVYTGNFSIERATLDAVGGFDESFTVYGNEDGELAIRLTQVGVNFVFETSAIAVQHHDKNLRQAFADARGKGRTAAFLARKHPAAAAELRLAQTVSRKRRAVRSSLVVASRYIPFVPNLAVRYVEAFERADGVRLDAWYERLFDYGYWLGVDAASRHD